MKSGGLKVLPVKNPPIEKANRPISTILPKPPVSHPVFLKICRFFSK